MHDMHAPNLHNDVRQGAPTLGVHYSAHNGITHPSTPSSASNVTSSKYLVTSKFTHPKTLAHTNRTQVAPSALSTTHIQTRHTVPRSELYPYTSTHRCHSLTSSPRPRHSSQSVKHSARITFAIYSHADMSSRCTRQISAGSMGPSSGASVQTSDMHAGMKGCCCVTSQPASSQNQVLPTAATWDQQPSGTARRASQRQQRTLQGTPHIDSVCTQVFISRRVRQHM